MDNAEIQKAVDELLQGANQPASREVVPLATGGNNRIYKVELPHDALLLKIYFQHPQDPRDRLNAEFTFCQFAWDSGLRCVPQPVASSAHYRLALYEFIRGRRISPADVSRDGIRQALDFYAHLNEHRRSRPAAGLPTASEACFTIDDHLGRVQRRLERLSTIEAAGDVEREAKEFVNSKLLPAWHKLEAGFYGDHGTRTVELSSSDRRLSPSDFGFHNALLTEQGQYKFVDFEYSGWDDPAKMVCDFFCQVAVPVPDTFFDEFAEAVAADQSDPKACGARIRMLLPVYRMKWICIVLNDFLPADAARKSFARGTVDPTERRRHQLEKARALLDKHVAG